MTVYVLVHGAWGGAHGFRHVRRGLRAAGYEVFTPSLTGIGERVHLASPQVDLSTHVRDVVNAVLYEDLDEIVLLGFSYGGMVVTGALAHIADRVAHLVYLDAFVPGDGDSAFGLLGLGEAPPISLGENWLIPPSEREYDDPDEAAWSNPRRTPQPAACFTEPVRLPQPLEAYPFSRTFIKATADPAEDVSASAGASASAFWAAAERAKGSSAWRYREIATNHMVPSNRPVELTELLLELDVNQ